jgi:hypothetical protein
MCRGGWSSLGCHRRRLRRHGGGQGKNAIGKSAVLCVWGRCRLPECRRRLFSSRVRHGGKAKPAVGGDGAAFPSIGHSALLLLLACVTSVYGMVVARGSRLSTANRQGRQQPLFCDSRRPSQSMRRRRQDNRQPTKRGGDDDGGVPSNLLSCHGIPPPSFPLLCLPPHCFGLTEPVGSCGVRKFASNSPSKHSSRTFSPHRCHQHRGAQQP